MYMYSAVLSWVVEVQYIQLGCCGAAKLGGVQLREGREQLGHGPMRLARATATTKVALSSPPESACQFLRTSTGHSHFNAGSAERLDSKRSSMRCSGLRAPRDPPALLLRLSALPRANADAEYLACVGQSVSAVSAVCTACHSTTSHNV